MNCCFLDCINCVRWSPSGELLASASEDKTVALLDFKAGKKLYSGKTSDGSKFSLFIKYQQFFSFVDIARSVCFI